ncbi:hypothetical protein QM012_005798 [Aureobasidium pullulans]|uniref:Nucleoprotein TPR/MLP1 domain-containing protein n=1 Tax=Aureobasidium pullulans TaxID=5580 RepID=A0ABR0TS81_AURPU
MPKSSQPGRPSALNHMERADSSDGPLSGNMTEPIYHEIVETTSIPTKSGTEVTIRTHYQSDDRVPTSISSSRPSSRGDELDQDAIDIIKKNSAIPSTEKLDIPTTTTFQKHRTDPVSECGFAFEKVKASSNTASGKMQSDLLSQSNHTTPPSSIEKSNQEHQGSAHDIQEAYPIASSSQATVQYHKAVQPNDSPLFQNISVVEDTKATQSPHAQENVPQNAEHSHMQVQRHPRHKSFGPRNFSMTRPHDNTMAQKDPIREQTMPLSRGDSPADTPLSLTGPVKDTEVIIETPADTEDIFTVTDRRSASPAMSSPPKSTEHAEQQDANLDKENSVPRESPQTDCVDIVMEDSTTPDGLAESNNANLVLKQLVHDNAHEDHHVQLTVQTQPLDDNQPASEEQHPISEQNRAKAQLLVKDSHPFKELQLPKAKQTGAPEKHVRAAPNALSFNDQRNGHHHQNSGDTKPTSLVIAQQSLHEITSHSGSPRVSKNRRKPSQPDLIARNSTANPKLNPSSYTAAQLYQLADQLKEQERLQEKQCWVKDLAAKQAELEKSNRHRASLQSECAQLKARLQKHCMVSEHLVTIVKAYNGIGHDIRGLQSSRAKYDRDLRELKSQVHAKSDAVTKESEQITKLERWKVDSLSLIRECKSSVATLTKEKSDLERRLRATSKSLDQEKLRHDAFDKHLQTHQSERKSTEEMLHGCINKISDLLGEFKTFIEKGTSSSELLELIKKENASISEQIRSSGTNMDALKTSVEQLASGIEKHVGDLKNVNNSISKTRTEAENKVVAALDNIRSQFKVWEEISEKRSAARESLAEARQNLESSKEKIAKLKEDLTNKTKAEAGLKEKIEELKSSQATLESDRAAAEASKARVLELIASESSLKQELEKLKNERAESMATIATIAEQKTTLQREKADLQGQISETTKLLENARRAVPNFGPEKAKIEANAKKQHEDAVTEMNTQVRKLSIDFANEKLRLEKKKEEVDRELAVRENTIRDLEFQFDRLRQDYGNRSPATWAEDLKQKGAHIQHLVDKNAESILHLKKLQQELDEIRQSTKKSLEKGAQDLQDRDRQIEDLSGANTAAQYDIKSLKQKLEEADRCKETAVKAIQEDADRASEHAQIRLKAMEADLTEANSAKCVYKTRVEDLEKQSRDEAEQRQKEISTLQQSLQDANKRLNDMNERHSQQQEVICQKNSNTEKLKQDIERLERDHAQAMAVATQISDSQPQETLQDQTSTPPAKKARRAVNRNVGSISKPTSSTASTNMTQTTRDSLQSTQSRSNGGSIFGPFSEPRGNGHVDRLEDLLQEEEEMLDLDNSRLQLAKTTSRPASSQSEAQRAFSLGSEGVLDDEGVRFRSRNNQSQAQTQPQSPKHVSSSSSLSEAPDFETYRNQLQYPWEESQSQNRAQASQQQTQTQQQSLDLSTELQAQQQSLDLSTFDDLAVASDAFETPMKTNGKNLQGVGKKLTPRPENPPKQSKPGALQSVRISELPKEPAVASQLQKRVSALSSGPHNFKTGDKGKGKRVTYDVSDAEDSDVYSPPSSSVRGSRSPQKRSVSQSTKVSKRQRTENATPAAARPSQRSVIATPRRSQSTTSTTGPQRRRSGRTNKEQNMMSRFNNEISSPRTRRG